MNRLIYILIVAGALGGCKKYLGEEPRKQASIQTAEQLETIINNNTIFVSNNGTNNALYFSTDDTDFPVEAYTANPAVWSVDGLMHFIFDVDGVAGASNDAFWAAEYRKILHANAVLENVDKVSGDEQIKNQLKADAYLIRAFSYFELANTYCLPYSSENENSMGLPLKTKSDYGESLKRSTLKELYKLIEDDLIRARSLAWSEVNPRLQWRASKHAAAAMLSRFYLIKGEYEKALNEANIALESSVVTLVDLNTLQPGRAQSLPWAPGIVLNYSELNDWGAALHLYWKEFYFTRFAYNSSQWQIPSNALLNLYDQTNDMRFKWFMIPNGNARFQITSPTLYRYTIFDDGRRIPLGPTISEMLLTKAEALARLGQVQDAMQTVNILREKRMKISLPLSAATKTEAITAVLNERRREMPFSMRWYDIRRFSVNEDPNDDVTVTHVFYPIENGAVKTSESPRTYTLAPGSLRYAVPINQFEVVNSREEIVQNKY